MWCVRHADSPAVSIVFTLQARDKHITEPSIWKSPSYTKDREVGSRNSLNRYIVSGLAFVRPTVPKTRSEGHSIVNPSGPIAGHRLSCVVILDTGRWNHTITKSSAIAESCGHSITRHLFLPFVVACGGVGKYLLQAMKTKYGLDRYSTKPPVLDWSSGKFLLTTITDPHHPYKLAQNSYDSAQVLCYTDDGDSNERR